MGLYLESRPAGRNAAESLVGTATPTGYWLSLLAPDAIADLVACERPEPTAETVAGSITVELLNVSCHGEEDLLENVGVSSALTPVRRHQR